ncbi:hypothetical protein D5085_04120 [Ectothiorhodospiraceae bacterium BW-2]|nr:hypothetical protein D5085_04120 [Ectothiorhodospiraceae bacterium BW-2]
MKRRYSRVTAHALFHAALITLLLGGCQTVSERPVTAATSTSPLTPPPSAPRLPAPLWYSGQQLVQVGAWIGYGEGDTLAEAKQAARADLSRTIQSQVTSQITIERQQHQGEVVVTARSAVEELSRAQFSELQTLRSEAINQRFYVALAYDNRPLWQRLEPLLTAAAAPPEHSVQELFSASPLQQQLQRHYGYGSYRPNAPLTLSHDGNGYRLHAADQHVGVRQREVALLLPPTQLSPQLGLRLEPQLTNYPPEQLFQVVLQPAISGYLSLIQIFGSGATVLNLANQPVTTAALSLRYPDPKRYEGLITELPAGQSETRVVHLALICHQPRDLSRFSALSSEVGQQPQSFLLGELPALLQGCHWSALSQRIGR